MKRFIIAMILLCALFQTDIYAQYNHKHYILMGRIDLSNEKFSDAIQNFNIAIMTKPNDFEGYFLRGIAKYSLSDFSGAIEDFTRTIDLHPLYVRAYHYRGVANDQLANYTAAMDDFHKAIGMDPYNEELHLACGSTLMHLNNYQDAIAEFDTALIINPENSNALISRGLAKRYIDDLDGAVQDLNLAVYNDFFNVEAVVRRGMIELDREKYEEAMEDFNAALKMDKDNPFIYFNRAIANLYLGDTMAALKDYEKVNNLDQRNALTYFNRGIIYTELGEYDVALALYNKTIEINPKNIYGYFNRGVLFCKMEMWDAAEEDFTTVIDLFPDFIDGWVNRAYVRFEKGDNKGAEMDRLHAREIMAFVSEKDTNIDSLYKQYAEMDYNKIIKFESDFVNGDQQGALAQFADVIIKPCGMYVVSVVPEKKGKLDIALSQITEGENIGGRLSYTTDVVGHENHVCLINDSIINGVKKKSLKDFLSGLYELEVSNYFRGAEIFRNLLEDPVLGVFSGINLAALQTGKAELVLVDDNYDNSVYITQKRVTDKNYSQKQVTPEYGPAATTLEMMLVKNKKNPYLWYNLGNIHLKMKEYDRAIDDYTMAIKYDSNFAEAYYNRALTLIFLRRNGMAVKDLSKAGELGITDAYVVMKRYTDNK